MLHSCWWSETLAINRGLLVLENWFFFLSTSSESPSRVATIKVPLDNQVWSWQDYDLSFDSQEDYSMQGECVLNRFDNKDLFNYDFAEDLFDRQFFRRRFLFVDETLDKNLLVLCWCCCWATRKTVNRVILSSSCYIEDDALISFCLPVPLLRLQSGHHSRQDVLLSLLCSMIVDPPFIPNMGWHETPKKPSSRYWTVQESTWPRNWSLEHHERK